MQKPTCPQVSHPEKRMACFFPIYQILCILTNFGNNPETTRCLLILIIWGQDWNVMMNHMKTMTLTNVCMYQSLDISNVMFLQGTE